MAVYLYDFSTQVNMLKLKDELIQKENQNYSLNLSQMTLSHEFRAPLSSTLMLLEALFQDINEEALRKIILMVISQINMLLCLVNDILDLKMIE